MPVIRFLANKVSGKCCAQQVLILIKLVSRSSISWSSGITWLNLNFAISISSWSYYLCILFDNINRSHGLFIVITLLTGMKCIYTLKRGMPSNIMSHTQKNRFLFYCEVKWIIYGGDWIFSIFFLGSDIIIITIFSKYDFYFCSVSEKKNQLPPYIIIYYVL